MSIVEAVRNYIASCPLLKDGRILGVDRIGADAIEYSIDVLPCTPVLQNTWTALKLSSFSLPLAAVKHTGGMWCRAFKIPHFTKILRTGLDAMTMQKSIRIWASFALSGQLN